MDNTIYSKLLNDETILWQGQPYIDKNYHASTGSFFLIIWGLFFVVVNLILYFLSNDWTYTFYIVPFYGFFVFLIITVNINSTKWKQKRKLEIKKYIYYVTNKRILVFNKSNLDIYYIYFENISDFKFDHNVKGIGNLYSSTPMIGSPFAEDNVCLLSVESALNVYKIIVPYLNSKQIHTPPKPGIKQAKDSSVTKNTTIAFPSNVSEMNMIEEVANTVNMPTIALITCIAINTVVVHAIRGNNIKSMRGFIFITILYILVLLYQVFNKINNRKQ